MKPGMSGWKLSQPATVLVYKRGSRYRILFVFLVIEELLPVLGASSPYKGIKTHFLLDRDLGFVSRDD